MKIIYNKIENQFEDNLNGFQVAKALNLENLKQVIAYKINDKIYDMQSKINNDCEISFLYADDKNKESFEILNHSTSHLMAEAILKLFPNAKLGFGPAIEEGFYYDVDLGDYQLKE